MIFSKIILLITFLLSYQVQCRTNLKLLNLQCLSLDLTVANFEKCALKAIKRDVTEISIKVHLLKVIHQTTVRYSPQIASASINLKLIKRGDDPRKPLYQYTIEFCKFIGNKRRHPIADIIYNLFSLNKYSNLNHSCPIDHDVILDHCRLDTSSLNMLSLKENTYTIITHYALGRKLYANVNISIHVY